MIEKLKKAMEIDFPIKIEEEVYKMKGYFDRFAIIDKDEHKIMFIGKINIDDTDLDVIFPYKITEKENTDV